MTAVSEAPAPAPGPGASTSRGETAVSAQAMHRLVEAAATEVDGVSRVTARGAPTQHIVASSAPQGSDGPTPLLLRLDAAITYPRPVTETAAELPCPNTARCPESKSWATIRSGRGMP